MALIRLVAGQGQIVHDKAEAERVAHNAAHPENVQPPQIIPDARALDAALRDTQGFFAFADDLEPRIVLVFHREPGPMWWVDHVWAPSALHDRILLRMCNAAIARGIGAQQVGFRTYGVRDLPIVQRAIAKAVTTGQRTPGGNAFITTWQTAATRLAANGVQP